MSNCFTDKLSSDTDTASSLCWQGGCYKLPLRVNKRFAGKKASVARSRVGGKALQHLRHGLLDTRELKWFGEVRVAGGLQKSLRVFAHHVPGEKEDAPRQFGLHLNRLPVEFLSVHLRHAEIGNDQVEIALCQQLQRIRGRVAKRAGVAEQTEHLAEQFRDRVFVVENEDVSGRRLGRLRQARHRGGG